MTLKLSMTRQHAKADYLLTWTESFSFPHPRTRLNVSQQMRLNNPTLSLQIADQDLRALFFRLLDHPNHVLCRVFVEQGGELCCGVIEGITGFEGLHNARDLWNKFFRSFSLNYDPLCGHADLARVQYCAGDDSASCCLDIGIVKNLPIKTTVRAPCVLYTL